MKQKYVKLFEEYVSQHNKGINEGIRDTVKDYGKRAKDYITAKFNTFRDLMKNLLDPKKIRKIPSGIKKNTPYMAYFSQEDGGIESQLVNFYKGTEYAEKVLNPQRALEDVNEGAKPKEWGQKIDTRWTGQANSVIDVTIDDVFDHLMFAYKTKLNYIENYKGTNPEVLPPFIYGAPGIGKTQVVAQVCDKLGIDLMVMDVQFYMPEDLMGAQDIEYSVLPMHDKKGNMIQSGVGATKHYPPERLQRTLESTTGGIIFLDELNRAEGPLLTKMMNFINDGRIDSFQLPPNWMIVAAGNRSQEGKGIFSIENEPAFKRRFKPVNMYPEIDKWVKWGKTKNTKFRDQYGRPRYLEEVFDFIVKNEELFYDNYTNREGAYPNPASWTRAASEVMDRVDYEGVDSWRDLDMNWIKNSFATIVGLDAALEVVDYLNLVKEFTKQDFKDIVENPQKARIVPELIKDIELRYAMIMFLFNSLSTEISNFEKSSGKKIEVDLQNRPKIFKMYRNICEYFARYKNFEQLAAAIETFQRQRPMFSIHHTKLTKMTPEEEEDLYFVLDLVNENIKREKLI